MIKRVIAFSVIFISLSACQTVAVEEKPIDWTQYAQNLSQQTFADERKDWGVDLKTEIRTGQYHAPTPTVIPDGKTVTTAELVNLLATHYKPLLIDVLGGKGHDTIPTAHWLKGAGTGTDFKDTQQARLKAKLQELSKGDAQVPIVFFCLSAKCWLSYNASLRAIELGYKNVLWYRGGLESWKAAGLPTVKTK